MPNRDGTGRLGRGYKCDAVARGDKSSGSSRGRGGRGRGGRGKGLGRRRR